ncbi:DUF899 family protein [Fervidibacillus halotolerans]|uniref:DUF899 family protein n=1 Tax=Fervidibacillus halotolerans TaxID=2980027 RepID=A0A9E8M0E8_9BACI|nr:DUF899 family protein [Fervidibacillus halotolerans]WAA13183.1 DUF899 family protein [Fervidibacillus halotolerans]
MNISEIQKEIEKLEQEIKEKKQRLVELKQSLPNRPVKNYQFTDSFGKPVTLSQLFGDKNELLVIQNMGKSCAYCTMWADGFNGLYHHITTKSAFVVATPDPPEVQRAFKAERRWQFPMISTMGTTFKEDFGFVKDGSQYPGVSSFKKDEEGKIYHVTDAYFGPWDDFCPVYPLFDLLPSGSKDFIPKKKIHEQSPFHFTNDITVQVKNAKMRRRPSNFTNKLLE